MKLTTVEKQIKDSAQVLILKEEFNQHWIKGNFIADA